MTFFIAAVGSIGTQAIAGNTKHRINNVEGINEEMLSPEFWQAKLADPESEVLSANQINKLNKDLLNKNSHMIDHESLADSINHEQLSALIKSISQPATSARFFADKRLVSNDDYSRFEDNLNLKAIKSSQPIQYGLVVKRTDLRTYPTHSKIFSTADDINLDRFQETALFPAQVVAIYHQSKDRQWYFVSSYNYSAWVAKKDVAIGKKTDVLDYYHAQPYLVITGDKVFTSSNPYNPKISQQQLEMGIRLPLVEEKHKPVLLDGQNTFASHVVKYPTRSEDGELVIQPALIAKSQDISIGYLPLNRSKVIRQAFKFLGERYGWGHSFNARDCTGFVGEIYKSFGILMPRNSGQQGISQQGENIRFSSATSNQEKLKMIKQLSTGDLIYLPGHVMMYLGQVNNQPYVIHDVAGYSYYDEQGVYQKSLLNGVSVTPLIPLQLNQETSYIDRIYNLKKIK